MATKAARGTKRTCQNPECGSRFYDLNRDPIICPICQSEYKIASAPQAVAAPEPDERARKPKKTEVAEDVQGAPDLPLVEGEEALADLEATEEPIAADDEETFIEPEEEDGGDVTGILGGSVAEDEEEP
jgi:uncharacterized protein (TIGR02300 family)